MLYQLDNDSEIRHSQNTKRSHNLVFVPKTHKTWCRQHQLTVLNHTFTHKHTQIWMCVCNQRSYSSLLPLPLGQPADWSLEMLSVDFQLQTRCFKSCRWRTQLSKCILPQPDPLCSRELGLLSEVRNAWILCLPVVRRLGNDTLGFLRLLVLHNGRPFYFLTYKRNEVDVLERSGSVSYPMVPWRWGKMWIK